MPSYNGDISNRAGRENHTMIECNNANMEQPCHHRGRPAPDQTVLLGQVTVVDPPASRQTYDRLDSYNIGVVRWKGSALTPCGIKAWTMSRLDTSTCWMMRIHCCPMLRTSCAASQGPGPVGVINAEITRNQIKRLCNRIRSGRRH